MYFDEFQSDERFDVIVFGYILEHVDDPVAVLKHFQKYLNLEGQMFITVPNAEVLNRRLGHLAGMLPNMQEMSEHDILLGNKRYYNLSLLKQDIESSGYQIKRIEGIYLKPLTTGQMLSLNLDPLIIDALCQMAVNYPELSCGIFAEIFPKAKDVS